jgi:hypothetical protein
MFRICLLTRIAPDSESVIETLLASEAGEIIGGGGRLPVGGGGAVPAFPRLGMGVTGGGDGVKFELEREIVGFGRVGAWEP